MLIFVAARSHLANVQNRSEQVAGVPIREKSDIYIYIYIYIYIPDWPKNVPNFGSVLQINVTKSCAIWMTKCRGILLFMFEFGSKSLH